jgi:hypothetical protein
MRRCTRSATGDPCRAVEAAPRDRRRLQPRFRPRDGAGCRLDAILPDALREVCGVAVDDVLQGGPRPTTKCRVRGQTTAPRVSGESAGPTASASPVLCVRIGADPEGFPGSLQRPSGYDQEPDKVASQRRLARQSAVTRQPRRERAHQGTVESGHRRAGTPARGRRFGSTQRLYSGRGPSSGCACGGFRWPSSQGSFPVESGQTSCRTSARP